MSLEDIKTAEDWEKWLAEGDLVPVFQPIVSAETGKIYGYEVLARLKIPQENGNSNLESLGPFFMTKLGYSASGKSMTILKREVDKRIRILALNQFAKMDNKEACIFLNISPSSMVDYLSKLPNELPYTIELIRDLNIQPWQVVIEITEEPINVSPEMLNSVLDLYRSEGYRIAIDDVGSESSNLDRIGLFHPDIIKVDLQMLRRSVFSRNFKEILQTLSKLGESLGSSLLFEGIETEDELYNALSYGSRFLQGFYFSKPLPEFLDEDSFSGILQKNIDQFHSKKTVEIQNVLKWENRVESDLSLLPLSLNQNENIVTLNLELLQDIQVDFFRLYITDSRGRQVSPNYFHNRIGKTQEDHSYIGRNWSWRPYFYEHSYKLANSQKNWIVSSVYHDINENVMLKTFSRNLKHDLILFIDVVV